MDKCAQVPSVADICIYSVDVHMRVANYSGVCGILMVVIFVLDWKCITVVGYYIPGRQEKGQKGKWTNADQCAQVPSVG